MATNGNPFYYGGAVEPRYFVGRRKELARVFAALNQLPAGQPQHVNIYGEKRIGKSSLLKRIQQDGRSHPDLQAHAFLYCDAAGIESREAFFRMILRELGGEPDGASLEDAAKEALRAQPHLPVCLLDELGAWVKRPDRFPDDFYDQLRSWMSTGLWAMVVVSPLPVAELSKGSPLVSSFFNIFGTHIALGPWNEAEADELLARAAQHDRPFTNEETAWLKRWARHGKGYHPAKLQLAARELFEAKARPPVDLDALAERLERTWEKIAPPPSKAAGLKRAARAVLAWPRPLGRAVAEMLGRQTSPSTQTIVGWVVLLFLLAAVAGWMPLERVVMWAKTLLGMP